MFKSGIYFALFACIVESALSLSDEQIAEFEKNYNALANKCAKEHTVSAETIAAIKDFEIPEDHDASCFGACILKEIGFLDADGLLKKDSAVERAKKVIDDADEIKMVEEFVDVCKDSVNNAAAADECERAKLLFKCFGDNADKFDY